MKRKLFMPTEKLKNDILFIIEHINEIESYFEEINNPNDFVNSKQGKAFYDAILMHLQVAGEILKRAYKENENLFQAYTEIPWNEIIRLRDLISHNYDKLEYEIVFDICKTNIKPLHIVLLKIAERL